MNGKNDGLFDLMMEMVRMQAQIAISQARLEQDMRDINKRQDKNFHPLAGHGTPLGAAQTRSHAPPLFHNSGKINNGG